MAIRTVIDLTEPQPGAGLQTRSITLGDRALTIVSNTPVQADSILAPVTKQAQATGGSSTGAASTLPLVVRAGAMYMDPSNPLYGNRPKIEIINGSATGTSSSPVAATYDQWILGQVQEGDSEKTDVHETFGSPFFFASGRFVRRFTFSGVVRGAPVNAQDKDPKNKVTQYALFRVFYENFLRMSQQALKGWYTRITVNKEIFEGYVSTFNCTMNAETEQFVPFVFTMFGTGRRNDMLDAAANSVLGSNGSVVPTTQSSATAKAEVSDAALKSIVTAVPSATDMGTLNFNNPVPYGIAQELINIAFSPRPEMLTVRSDTPGIQPVYSSSVFAGGKSNIPLHGSVPPVAGPFPIDFKITDYWTLYNSVLARSQTPELLVSTAGLKPLPPGQLTLLPGQANFTVITASKQTVTFAVRFHLTPPANVVVGSIREFVSGSQMQIGAGSVIPPNSDNTEIVLGTITSDILYDGTNTVSLQIRYFLSTPDGSPVPPDALNNATVVYDIQTVTPVLGASLIPVGNSNDLNICQALATVDNVLTAVPEENSLYNEFSFKLNSDSMLNAVNPFMEADRVVIKMRPTITLAGYPILKVPSLLTIITSPSAPTKYSLKQLSFIGAIWDPIQTQVKVTDNNVSQRLDQFGFLRFIIQTAENVDVPASVYAAIKQSTLSFTTRFATGAAYSAARVDPVPLNGIAYGSGELLDPDTQQRVFLRTRQSDLSYDPSLGALVLTIEINTTYQSGFAAYLYSTRFWAYISEVMSASLNLTPSTSINPPASWVKGQ